jgi:hypothetical protein
MLRTTMLSQTGIAIVAFMTVGAAEATLGASPGPFKNLAQQSAVERVAMCCAVPKVQCRGTWRRGVCRSLGAPREWVRGCWQC